MSIRSAFFSLARPITYTALCLSLAACGSTTRFSGSAPDTQVAAPAPATTGEQIGSGPVRVAVILPLTGSKGPSQVGASLKNAAAMALSEAHDQKLTLLIKDDQSTPAGAQAAAQAAIAEGAEIIIGPLFAQNVREVGRVARAADKPVIAFSTDANVASRGIYLLSFLIESEVDRVVDFAASKGKKSFAALIPDDEYGKIAEAAFMQATARNGIRVQQVERYSRQANNLAPAIERLSKNTSQFDALFVPEQADVMSALAPRLKTAGLTAPAIRLVGTGLWNDPRVWKLPDMSGAWFASPDSAGFQNFSRRYQARYGAAPSRVATLSYDALSLTVSLANSPNAANRFSESILTNPQGFAGSDGVFRFQSDGLNVRALSILQIDQGTTSVAQAASRSFQ